MSPQDLAALLQNNIQINGDLNLTTSLITDIAPLLNALHISTLTLGHAVVKQVPVSKSSGAPIDAQVTVTGQVSFLNVNLIPATLYIATTSPLQICLKADLPVNWKFTDSVPNVPMSMYPISAGSNVVAFQKCLLDDLVFQEAHWLLTNYADESTNIEAGLNLSAVVNSQSILADVVSIMKLDQLVTLQGSVQLSPSFDNQASVALYFQAPGKILAVGPIHLSNVHCRIRSTNELETPAQETRFEIGGIIEIGSPDPAILELWTAVHGGGSVWYLNGKTDDSKLSIKNGVDAIVELAGGSSSDFHLPDSLQSFGNIYLKGFSTALGFSEELIEHVSLTVGSDASWTLIPDFLSVGNMSVTWFILFPLDSELRHNSIGIAGTLSFGQGTNKIIFDVTVQSDRAFNVSGMLSQGQTLHVADIIKSALSIDADIPVLDIDELYFNATSRGDFEIGGGSPTTWKIPIGIVTLEFGNLYLNVLHISGNTPSNAVKVAGTISISGNQFVVAYNSPGDFNISGNLPNINFKELVKYLLGDVISYPSSFPEIQLQNSNVLIQKNQNDYIFELSTKINDWGTAVIEVVRNNGDWGVAAGFALPSGWKLSRIIPFDIFDSFSFSSLALVLASFDDTHYKFPGDIVPGINGVVKGINFYADLSLSGNLLDEVSKIIGESSLKIKAAIGMNPHDTFLAASIGKTVGIPPVNNLVLSGGSAGEGLALAIYASPLSASISGALTIPIGDQSISFIGRLIISENAFTFAADVEAQGGSLLNPIGFHGVALNEIGIALSAEFEPPTLALTLEGQFALKGQPPSSNKFAFSFGVEGEVINPQLLSCKFAELDLPIIFNACMDGSVTLPDALNEIKFTDVFIYWCDIPTTLPDGTTTERGFGFNGSMNFFGWKAHAYLMMTFSNGITGDAEMDPIKLGAGILSITGKSKNGGPAVAVSTISSPYFSVTLNVLILGISGTDVNGQISNSGFEFSLQQQSFKFLDETISCVLTDPTHFSLKSAFNITLDLELGPLELPGISIPLGTIHVQGGFSGSLVINLNGDEFSAELDGGISWQGMTWSIPTLKLNVMPSSLADLVQKLIDHIIAEANTIFKNLFYDPGKWAEFIKAGIIAGFDDVVKMGNALKDAFGLGGDAVAQLMKDAGFDIDDITKVLSDVFGDAPDVITPILTGLGYSNVLIAGALKSMGVAVETIAGLFKDLGLSADDVQSVLEAVGYPAEVISDVISDIFSCSCVIEIGPLCISDFFKCPIDF